MFYRFMHFNFLSLENYPRRIFRTHRVSLVPPNLFQANDFVISGARAFTRVVPDFDFGKSGIWPFLEIWPTLVRPNFQPELSDASAAAVPPVDYA